MNGITILQGDVREVLKTLPDESVNCVVTSPPYWGLRDYGCEGQIGLESTPAIYVCQMVGVFQQVMRVLRSDGTLWLNMGDSYASNGGHADTKCNDRRGQYNIGRRPEHENRHFRVRGGKDCDPKRGSAAIDQPYRATGSAGLKPKDLVGMPWRLAFALQENGWYLRSDIIWHKPNPMPESVTDRPTKSHEYIFLLTKSERYYYNAEAIMEPTSSGTHERRAATWKTPDGWDTSKGEGGHGTIHKLGREDGAVKVPASYKGSVPGRNGGPGQERRSDRERGVGRKLASANPAENRAAKSSAFGRGAGWREAKRIKNNESFDAAMAVMPEMRNKRSVWTVGTQAFPEAHFATFPEELIKPCILAGCPAGGTVLDPFGGSGTTALVARANGCKAILVELNPEYIKIAERRLAQEHLDFTGGLDVSTVTSPSNIASTE